jgi:hypothetical protein
MVAVKSTLSEPACTVTVDGTATAELSLDKLMPSPPLAAEALSEIVQLTVASPVIDALLQVRPFSAGMPVPLKLIVAVLLVDEFVLTAI